MTERGEDDRSWHLTFCIDLGLAVRMSVEAVSLDILRRDSVEDDSSCLEGKVSTVVIVRFVGKECLNVVNFLL